MLTHRKEWDVAAWQATILKITPSKARQPLSKEACPYNFPTSTPPHPALEYVRPHFASVAQFAIQRPLEQQ
jgi:hypothetical protein